MIVCWLNEYDCNELVLDTDGNLLIIPQKASGMDKICFSYGIEDLGKLERRYDRR